MGPSALLAEIFLIDPQYRGFPPEGFEGPKFIQKFTPPPPPFFIPVNYRRLTIYSNLQFMITGIEMNLDP